MRIRHCVLACLAGAAALSAAAAPATAQLNNQPWGGAGISSAAREAILAQHLFGREPRNLQRSADGRLVDVIERDRQPFLARPDPDLLVALPRPGWGAAVGGAGIGLSGGGAAVSIGGWTAMLDARPIVTAAYGPGLSSSPVDAWVNDLDGLGRLE